MHEGDYLDYSNLTEFFGVDSFYLKSVGITIGSSTTHLMFSELLVRRSDSRMSRFEITERKVIYKSPILFTPYAGVTEVDTGKLHDFFKKVYKEAGYTPEDVDTGAIIITGYAARKENADAILELFSRWAGKFVCATAGPNLESLMAAHGSGAVFLSEKTGKTVMNIDVGGGSSKIAIIQAGTIVDSSSIYVGSRVIATEKEGQVIRTEASAIQAAKELNMELRVGRILSIAEMKDIAVKLTQSLFEVIERKELSPFTQKIMETPPIQYNGKIDIIMFSGGVAEYIYGFEKMNFEDLGPYLGEMIKHRVDNMVDITHQEPAERIRATVMGAAQYSLQVSGNTIFLSSDNVLPKRNLKVVKVKIHEEKLNAEQVDNIVRKALSKHDLDKLQSDILSVLAIDLPSEAAPTYDFLRAISQGVLSAWRDNLNDDIILLLNLDVAKLIGNILVEDMGYSGDIICLDGIDVGDLDYVDIGTEIQYSRTVPVIVKNLVFFKGMDD